jgi:hypothetical protein
MKTLKAASALAVLALAFLPTAALAHTGTATVSCTSADFSFAKFDAGSNTVNYQITVDGVTAAQGTYTLDAAGGTQGHLAVPLAVTDSHEVRAFAWWGPAGVQNGHTRPATSPPLADQVVHCPPAPAPPAPLTPAAPAPVAATPVAAAPAPAAPATAVEADRARSAPSARLAVRGACTARNVRVTVSGSQIRQVSFSVEGHHAKTVQVATGVNRITTSLPLRRHGPAVQTVTSRVSFRNGARSRTLRATARRCSAVSVRPQFTG